MDKLYEFVKRPENVRQIGEPGEKERIYFEDYVVTYMNRILEKYAEKKAVILFGRKGKEECAGSYFIYGGVEVDFDLLNPEQGFSVDKWDDIQNQRKTYFPESQILGWGVGIRMETTFLKKRLQEIHKKHFSGNYQICCVLDQSEEMKYVYSFDGFGLKKTKGYMVYYGKNPQMQNYMLRGEQKASLEASYTDTVMKNVRAAIKKNEVKRKEKKSIATAVAAVFTIMLIVGGAILIQSNRKLEKLEKTIAVVSETDYYEKKPEETAASEEEKKEQENQKPEKTGSTKEPETEAKEKKEPEKKETEKKDENPDEKLEKQVKTKTTEKKEKTVSKKKKTKKKEQSSKKTAISQNSYIIQKGDTLSQIVWRQYRDLSKLSLVKERNHIEDENQIREGQRIILPVY